MRIGRWHLYRRWNRLYLERGPDPDCGDCGGDGYWLVNSPDPDCCEPDECICLCSHGPYYRVPYRPARRLRAGSGSEPPF